MQTRRASVVVRRARGFVLSLGVLTSVAVMFDAHAAPVTQKIIEGTTVDEEEYPYAVRLSYTGALLCSGTLVGDKYVLTAAHCFFDDTNSRSVGDTEVVARLNGQEYTSAHIYINPSYIARSSACFEDELDAAIVELSEVVPGVTPVALLENPVANGASLRLVGYGLEGTEEEGEGDTIPSIGYVNYGSTTVEGFGLDPEKPSTSSDYYFWKFDTGESNTASGDSGGPAFQFFDGVPFLTGITCGGEGNAQAGTYSFNTRADVLAPWVREVMGEAPSHTAPILGAVSPKFAARGVTFSLSLALAGSGPVVVTAKGLPPGVVVRGSKLYGKPSRLGRYVARITATNAYGKDRANVVITVASFASYVRVANATLVYDGKPQSDFLELNGSVAVGERFQPRNAKVQIAIGGLKKTYTLDSKGASSGAARGEFSLKGSLRSGRFVRSRLPFTLQVSGSELGKALKSLGFVKTALAESGEQQALPLSVTVQGVPSTARQTLEFDSFLGVWTLP